MLRALSLAVSAVNAGHAKLSTLFHILIKHLLCMLCQPIILCLLRIDSQILRHNDIVEAIPIDSPEVIEIQIISAKPRQGRFPSAQQLFPANASFSTCA